MKHYFSTLLIVALTLSFYPVLAEDYQGDIEQLPQMIKEDRMSDSHIAGIIREKDLSSNIIQDLIETDLLGEESLKAIMDTSPQKRTIWDQFLSLFGMHQQSYADKIFEQYELSESLEQKLILREDLSSENKESLQQNMVSRRSQRMAVDNFDPEPVVQRKTFSLTKAVDHQTASRQFYEQARQEEKSSENKALANTSSNNNSSGIHNQIGQEEHNSSAEPQGQMESQQNTTAPEHENSSNSEASSSVPKSSSGNSGSSSSGSGSGGGSSGGSSGSGRR